MNLAVPIFAVVEQARRPLMTDDVPGAAPGKPLTDAARRALREAAARKALQAATDPPPEDGGPAGLEPTRFGDWERKGIAVDF
jgi:hypothetical protein